MKNLSRDTSLPAAQCWAGKRSKRTAADNEKIIYDALNKVFVGKGYGEIVLNDTLKSLDKDANGGYITALFYGVIEKSVEFDYVIRALTDSPPKKPIRTLLKMGMYLMKYMDKPSYAVINKIVNLSVKAGKGGAKGFVNAVLRKFESFVFPARKDCGSAEYLSFTYSCPLWLVKKLSAEKGEAFTEEFLSYKAERRPHIRRNLSMIEEGAFFEKLKRLDANAQKTPLGWYVDYAVTDKIYSREFTMMSISSMIAVQCYAVGLPEKPSVLDMCAAPGGKAVYLYELTGADILAADLYPHRAELIKNYAGRMGAKIRTAVSDGSVYNAEWANRFDSVICDVPCSGIGVFKQRPDILLNREPEDIAELTKLSAKILDNAAHYVKVGGQISYSTCTVLREENEDAVCAFLKSHLNFKILPIDTRYAETDGEGYIHLYPQRNGGEGFFIAKLLRIE